MMSDLSSDPTSGSAFSEAFAGPITGVFHSSWWTVLRWELGMGIFFTTWMLVIGWFNGAPWLVAFGAVISAGYALVGSVAYRFWGVATVEITSDAIVVAERGQSPIRMAWAEIREAHLRSREWVADSWLLRDAHERVVIPELGFTTDEWLWVGRGIRDWKASGPLATLPGVAVKTGRSRSIPSGHTFSPRHPLSHRVGFAFCLVLGLGAAWLGLLYGETQAERLLFGIGGSVFALGSVGALLWWLRRAPTLIVFAPEALMIERRFRIPTTVSYRQIMSAWGGKVETRGNDFWLGERDFESFQRLLAHYSRGIETSGMKSAAEPPEASGA